MRGWPKPDIARIILSTSAVALLGLAAYGIWGMVTGYPSASLGLFVAAWLGVQSWQLYQAYKSGPAALEMYPLFRGGADDIPPGGAPAGRICVSGLLAVALALGNLPATACLPG